jgi:ribosome-associated heat shock protein Hsp15
MRIDKFLHCIRLVKSRTLAQGLVEEGRTRIDGRRATKVSDAVRIGSVIALPLRGEVRVLRVLALPTRRGPPAEARACYEELGEGRSLGQGVGVDEAPPSDLAQGTETGATTP